MSLAETTSYEAEISEAAIPQGWQCCLLCGRTLTDRALHDALEEPVLAAIRAEHPEWSSVDGACQPCVNHYRNLLRERLTREARLEVETQSRWPTWASKLFGYRGRAGG
jgi:hypothetical protein